MMTSTIEVSNQLTKITRKGDLEAQQKLDAKAQFAAKWTAQISKSDQFQDRLVISPPPTTGPQQSETFFDSEDAPDTLYVDLGFGLRELFFPPYSIFECNVLVGEVRKKAAETFGLHIDRTFMYYRGNELVHDELPVRNYGCRHYSLITVQIDRGLNPFSPGGSEQSRISLIAENQLVDSQGSIANEENAKKFVDSAYGTATHSMSDLSQPTQSVGNSENQGEVFEPDSNGDDNIDERDEIESVISDHEDIQSQVNTKYSPIVQEAEKQLRFLFLENPIFYRLCKELKARTNVEKFSTNIRRLLKLYYKAQREVAQTRLEHAAISLLRNHNARYRIATLIANGVGLAPENAAWDAALAAMKDPGSESRVESWLGGNLAFTLKKSLNRRLESDDDLMSEESEQDQQYENIHIRAVEVFLLQSDAFKKLLFDIQLMVMPKEVKPLAQTLATIPSQDISFHSTYLRPLFYFWQRRIKGWSALNLPFHDPEVYRLGSMTRYTRISWRCYCNRHLSADISSSHLQALQDLLALKEGCVFGPNLCQAVFQPVEKRGFRNLFSQILNSLKPSSLTSDSGSQPTASSDWTSSNRPHSPSRSSDSVVSTSTSDSTSLSSQSRGVSLGSSVTSPSPSLINVEINDRYVLLGIKGQRRALEMSHIDTKTSNNDRKFFSEARTLYLSTRGLLRRIFAIWQLSHCDFVKFRKHLPNRTHAVALDLPLDEEEYSYKPRPPQATPKNQIDNHIWPVLLSTPCCETRLGKYFGICILQWTHEWIHDCVPALKPDTTDLLDRIPQKKSRWLLETDGTDEAWGIHTVDTISAHHVVVYHLFMLFGPFVFWAMWPQTSNSQEGATIDLQNASVPLMIVIGLMSMSASVWAAIRPISSIDNK